MDYKATIGASVWGIGVLIHDSPRVVGSVRVVSFDPKTKIALIEFNGILYHHGPGF